MDPFDIPEDIAALVGDTLDNAIAAALTEGATLAAMADADLTDEQVERMGALADFVTAATAERETRLAAAAARAERVAAARGALSVAPPAAPEPPAPPAVTASGGLPGAPSAAAAAVRGGSTAPTPPAQALGVITAAADVPGFSTGTQIADFSALAEAAIGRFQAMPTSGGPARRDRYGLARLTKPRNDGTKVTQFGSAMEAVLNATSESRLPGGSLTAAGGWCAPSVTDFGLPESLLSTDGIIDVPEVGIERGGLSFTRGLDFTSLFSEGFDLTEAQLIAGGTKDSFEVECADFEEVRPDAVGLWVKASILKERAFPELISRTIADSLIAHQHKIATKIIGKILTDVGAAVSVVNAFPNAVSLLSALELVAEGERQFYRMQRGRTLEVKLPMWTHAVIRADLANRNGVDSTAVTDEQINAHFAVRGLAVQFIYNWQGLVGSGVGNAGPVIDYPASVEALIYPAGTYLKGTDDVITLDAVYDSTDLASNVYTALFQEERVFLARVAHRARRISLPLYVSGRTGAADITAAWGEDVSGI